MAEQPTPSTQTRTAGRSASWPSQGWRWLPLSLLLPLLLLQSRLLPPLPRACLLLLRACERVCEWRVDGRCGGG